MHSVNLPAFGGKKKKKQQEKQGKIRKFFEI
jgi:hypothetical protein